MADMAETRPLIPGSRAGQRPQHPARLTVGAPSGSNGLGGDAPGAGSLNAGYRSPQKSRGSAMAQSSMWTQGKTDPGVRHGHHRLGMPMSEPKRRTARKTPRERTNSMPSVSTRLLMSFSGDDADSYAVGLASSGSTAANMVKAVAGAAVFAMPYVFLDMGIAGAAVVLMVLTVLSGYTMTLLLSAKHLVAEETLGQYISYVDISRHAFGETGAKVTYVLSVIASLGVAAANVTFVGQTIVSLLEANGFTADEVKTWYFTVGSLVIISPLTWLRSFKILAIFSVVGNVCLIAGIVGTIGFGFHQRQEMSRVPMLNLERIPDSLGTASFVFCINFLLLPIERSMATHSQFVPLMWGAFGGVSAIIIAFGAVTASLFAKDTCGNVLLNLNPDHGGVSALKAALCIAQLASFPLSIAPACETIEQSVMPYIRRKRGIKRRVVRQILIFVTIGMGQIKSFTMITNLIGGLTSLPLTLILPPLLYIRLALRPRFSGDPEVISNDESAAFKEREADLLSVSEDTDEDRDRDNDRDPDRQSQHSRADSGMEPSREPSEAGDADDDGTVAGADVAGDHVRKITTRFPGGRAAAFLANYPSNRSLQHRASAPYGHVLTREGDRDDDEAGVTASPLPPIELKEIGVGQYRDLVMPAVVMLIGTAITAVTIASTVRSIVNGSASTAC